MIKKLIPLILIVMAQSVNYSSASEPITFKLWNNNAPTSNDIPVGTEKCDEMGRITNVSEPEITVYPSDNPNGMALIMCPGGGYFCLAALFEGSELAKPLNEEGITLAVLKYRLPNGHHEIPADDARKAFEVLRSHAGEFGIDPDKIGIGGASAGGHLATTVTAHPDSVNPAFQVLFYPVITMEEAFTHAGSRNLLLGANPSEVLVDYYSNEKHVTGATPPTFIAVSQDDTGVKLRNSTDYFNALVANNVPVSFHVYPTGGHGWLCPPEFIYKKVALNELTLWLRQLYR